MHPCMCACICLYSHACVCLTTRIMSSESYGTSMEGKPPGNGQKHGRGTRYRAGSLRSQPLPLGWQPPKVHHGSFRCAGGRGLRWLNFRVGYIRQAQPAFVNWRGRSQGLEAISTSCCYKRVDGKTEKSRFLAHSAKGKTIGPTM